MTLIKSKIFSLLLLMAFFTACQSKVNEALMENDTTEKSVATPSSNSSSTPQNLQMRPSNPGDCQFNGVLIPNGQKRKVYKEERVSCTAACQAGNITCENGVLTGNTDYTGLGCSQICSCVLPWGELVEQGKQSSAYQVDILNCSDTKNCEDASNKITVKCSDSFQNKFDVVSGTGTLETFSKRSCARKSCSCYHLGVMINTTDPPLNVYRESSKTAPAKCDDGTNIGKVTCKQEGENFVTKGDVNTSLYKYTQCKDAAASSGSGNSESNVGAGNGGGTGGGLGNDNGEGEGFRRRGKGGGEGCDVNKPPYFCAGGSGGFDVQNGLCFVPGPNGYLGIPAEGNKNISNRVSGGSYVYAFDTPSVACGDRCSNHRRLVRCSAGSMNDKDKFKYRDCQEACP